MRVTEVLPTPGAVVDVDAPDARAWLAERYRRDDDAYLRLNMITSLTGAAAGADGTSDTLTSRLDRTVLGVIRADADVVLVGAASVRAEGYVVPRTATLAIVSTTGRLDGHRLDDSAAGRVLMLVPGGARPDAPRGVETVAVGDGPRLSPAGILSSLAERGLRRVVCEGGPSLASQFARAGLIDEYCLTLAPRLTPATAPLLDLAAPIDLDVRGMLVDDDGFSYLRARPASRARS